LQQNPLQILVLPGFSTCRNDLADAKSLQVSGREQNNGLFVPLHNKHI